MTAKPNLFDPISLGRISLSNRIVMAPMTRSRAGEGDVPTAMNVEYYRQRAGAGLIITEGTQPSPNGKGYCRTPGIHSVEQVAGWKKVVDAVHAEGGKIVLQIMHCGRIASHLNRDAGTETVAPSAIQAKGEMYTDAKGMVPFDEPRALKTDEIPAIVEEYRQATKNAYEAGFDGVELHCTSGYLPAQFLSTGTNHRSDQYGGSVQNRCRFVLEVLQAMASVDGADRVGMRICPGNPFNNLRDEDPEETFATLLDLVEPLGLAYLHVIQSPWPDKDNFALGRAHFSGKLILNESFDLEKGQQALADGTGELVSYARHFISNPDLVRRFKEDAPLNDFDNGT
ncbi:MAG: alkene reductase, partial [Pseudomonadales bacterium]